MSIFRDDIGELEPIVGDRIQTLIAQYLREELAAAELDEKFAGKRRLWSGAFGRPATS